MSTTTPKSFEEQCRDLERLTPFMEGILVSLHQKLVQQEEDGLDTSETLEFIDGYTDSINHYREIAARVEQLRSQWAKLADDVVSEWRARISPEGRS